MTNLFFMHGMGGAPEDWTQVRRFIDGKTLTLPKIENFSPTSIAKAWSEEIKSNGPLTLCGYSMGGRLTILLAEHLLQIGLPPKKLILLASGLGLASVSEREVRQKQDEDWARLAETSTDFWEKWYAQELFLSFRNLPAETKNEWLKSRKSIDSKFLSSQLRSLSPSNHEYLLPKLHLLKSNGISVLYIVGELDKKYLELAKNLESEGLVDVEQIPGAGHILPLEAPQTVAAAITNYCKGA